MSWCIITALTVWPFGTNFLCITPFESWKQINIVFTFDFSKQDFLDWAYSDASIQHFAVGFVIILKNIYSTRVIVALALIRHPISHLQNNFFSSQLHNILFTEQQYTNKKSDKICHFSFVNF